MKTVFLAAISLLLGVSAQANSKFPLREKYPKIPTIEMKEFEKSYNKDIVVDARSSFEFDIIHIAKAKHDSVSNSLFLSNLEKIRSKHGKVPLVMYCNGTTCPKSFEAAEKAINAGYTNLKVFDAGVMAWASAHPEKTYLLGKIPADHKKIISAADYKARFVKYDKMKAAENKPGSIFYDVRDPIQRKSTFPIKGIRELPLDRITPLLKASKFKDNDLYFIDEVGKQNEWLQYYLNEYGYKKYWFLDGGADSLTKNK